MLCFRTNLFYSIGIKGLYDIKIGEIKNKKMRDEDQISSNVLCNSHNKTRQKKIKLKKWVRE